MQRYRTTQIAQMIGLHPNTIRLYEELEYIAKPVREGNGYRVFTEVHLEQLKLARLALRGEILLNGLRGDAKKIIKTSATGRYEDAAVLTERYLMKIRDEKNHAETAIGYVKLMLEQTSYTLEKMRLTRKQAADHVNVTVDTLRNWEMNGLLMIKRKENGYRIYDENDLMWLEIIRFLRCAGYSLTSILRMINDFHHSLLTDIKSSIDTPKETESLVYVCDHLITSLANAELDAQLMLDQLKSMKNKFL